MCTTHEAHSSTPPFGGVPRTRKLAAEWNQVVFSDESRFNRSSDDNRVRVWRPVVDASILLLLYSDTPLPQLKLALVRRNNIIQEGKRKIVRFHFLLHGNGLWKISVKRLAPLETLFKRKCISVPLHRKIFPTRITPSIRAAFILKGEWREQRDKREFPSEGRGRERGYADKKLYILERQYTRAVLEALGEVLGDESKSPMRRSNSASEDDF
ncbi:hypothetical protein TNCV_2017801 [Trichonephila clavipes]|nr:hypothetical protein TNCV_2017801 [Trichonephila clavipes]